MTEEVQAKKYFSNKVLLIVLGVLILVIIGLIIGVVVVNMNGGREVAKVEENVNQGETVSATEKTEEQKRTEDEMTIVNAINQEIQPMEDMAEVQSYLDQKVEEYAGESVQPRIKMMKVWVYVNDNQPEEALAMAEGITEEEQDDSQKMNYYAAMAKIYDGLGDEEKAQSYQDQWKALYDKLYDGGHSF